mmetsp:Transcript_11737/g.16798  ORF Transcript_11737/g.16798 Transcript_11737/m.16798 type:complete len:97 (+) Transcript_11737:203-493(+)
MVAATVGGRLGEFKNLTLIGKGSFGRVYRAVRLSDNQECVPSDPLCLSVTPPLVLSAHATRCPRVGPALEVWHQGSPCTSLPMFLCGHFARKPASV